MGQEQSQQEQQDSVFFYTVASGKDGKDVLEEAESKDHSRQLCSRSVTNAYSRRSDTYQSNSMSEDQEDSLLVLLEFYRPRLPYRLKDIQATIVPLMPSADGGMPHTRPDDVICVPLSSHPISLETFTHELWHLHQRAFYSEWLRFFEEHWHFKRYTGDIPTNLQSALRINPDTMKDPLWIWQDKWVPLCVFLNPVSPSLGATAVWFYNTKTGIHHQQRPPEMAAFFSKQLPSVAYEHPCELAAYIKNENQCPAYQAFQKVWLQ